jgi:hypothetical protein
MSDRKSKDYAKGYSAGRKYGERAIERTRRECEETRQERVYLACLDLALKHCSNWRIDDKEVKDCIGYSKLAKVFADNAISRIN